MDDREECPVCERDREECRCPGDDQPDLFTGGQPPLFDTPEEAHRPEWA